MKKSEVITIVIIIIAIIIASSIFIYLNKKKNALTVEEFDKIMIQKGYTIENVGNTDNTDNIHIITANNYKVRFYDFRHSSFAISFYDNVKNYYKIMTGKYSKKFFIQFKNYAKCSFLSDTEYITISRIGNTVIFITADSKEKGTIDTLLDELGY